MSKRSPETTGLILAGGGARAAYQVGVLKAIMEICEEHNITHPFQIFSGVSAGSINAVFMAGFAHDLKQGIRRLGHLWRHITPDQVFSTNPLIIGKTGWTWLKSLSLGGLFKTAPAQALLDTRPLYQLLTSQIPFDHIAKNIEQNHLSAVAITATDYISSHSVTFVQPGQNFSMWQRHRRHSEEAEISADHVMASSAIPIFFPPILLHSRYYGDGCLRNTAPFSPAIHLGATKIVAIGVRKHVIKREISTCADAVPTLARILGILLDSVFLDNLDLDAERLRSINGVLTRSPQNTGLRPVDLLYIQPSEDLGTLAQEQSPHLPYIMQYLIKGLGSLEEASEIISFLLFEATYCSQLIQLGYRDGMAQRAELEAFFSPS